MSFALLELLGRFFKFLIKYRGRLPSGSAGLYIVVVFFFNLFSYGPTIAVREISKSVFATELTIHENVLLAINNSSGYGLFQFFEILMSLMILIVLVKFITRVLVGVSGSQAVWGAYLISLIIVGLLEIGSVKIINGTWGFIPLWDGVVFLFLNLKPVLINAIPNFLTNLRFVPKSINNSLNNSLNNSFNNSLNSTLNNSINNTL